jgi:hypothetical protein
MIHELLEDYKFALDHLDKVKYSGYVHALTGYQAFLNKNVEFFYLFDNFLKFFSASFPQK